MPNPKQPVGTEVDPSEGSIDEGAEQQSFQVADERENSSMLEVDPSEGPE